MRKRLGKRGSSFFESIYFIMFQVFLVTGAGLLMLGYVISKADNTSFEKQYYSRDMALLINTIYASPGNVIYTYDSLPKNYSATIIKKGVIINDTFKKEKAIPLGFPHVIDTNINVEGFDKTYQGSPIMFIKRDNNLKIGTNIKPELEISQCRKIMDKNLTTELGQVAIIPSYHEEYDVQLMQKEKAITEKIARTFKSDNYLVTGVNDTLNQIYTKTTGYDTTLVLTLAADTDPNEQPDNKVNIYYVSNDQNTTMKLACLIMQELINVEGVEAGEIIQTEEDTFAWVHLRLELGNLNSGYDFDNNYLRLSYAIRNAMEFYER